MVHLLPFGVIGLPPEAPPIFRSTSIVFKRIAYPTGHAGLHVAGRDAKCRQKDELRYGLHCIHKSAIAREKYIFLLPFDVYAELLN
jgi:hypothetical protein